MNTGFRANSQVGYISIKLISHYISLHMLKPSVLDDIGYINNYFFIFSL